MNSLFSCTYTLNLLYKFELDMLLPNTIPYTFPSSKIFPTRMFANMVVRYEASYASIKLLSIEPEAKSLTSALKPL